MPAGVTTKRPQRIVGRRQEPRREARRLHEPGGHGRERLAVAQRLRADEVEPEVEVAEHEPSLAAPLDAPPRACATSPPRAPSPAPRRSAPRARRGPSRGRARRACRAPRRRRRRCRSRSARPARARPARPRASLAPPTPPERHVDPHRGSAPSSGTRPRPAARPDALEVGRACRRRPRGSGARGPRTAGRARRRARGTAPRSAGRRAAGRPRGTAARARSSSRRAPRRSRRRRAARVTASALTSDARTRGTSALTTTQTSSAAASPAATAAPWPLARVVDGLRAELDRDETARRVVGHDAHVAGRDGRLDHVAEHRQGDVDAELGGKPALAAGPERHHDHHAASVRPEAPRVRSRVGA